MDKKTGIWRWWPQFALSLIENIFYQIEIFFVLDLLESYSNCDFLFEIIL